MNSKVRKPLPSVEFLDMCLSYCRETGVFTWKHRPRESFTKNNAFRAYEKCFAGKTAGYVTPEGYVLLNIQNTSVHAHRVAWKMHYGVEPPHQIDHIDDDKANNRIDNLREATGNGNFYARGKSKLNTTGYKSVMLDYRSGSLAPRYHADLTVNGVRHQGPRRHTAEEAAEDVREFAVRLHGEFVHPSVLNPIYSPSRPPDPATLEKAKARKAKKEEARRTKNEARYEALRQIKQIAENSRLIVCIYGLPEGTVWIHPPGAAIRYRPKV